MFKEIKRNLINRIKKMFFNSGKYWEKRYAKGDNSGEGSYNKIAEFKAEILNKFIKEKDIHKLLDYGCGDGNQAKYINVQDYIGIDISKTAISMCKEKFVNDKYKLFYVFDDNFDLNIIKKFNPEVVISLDIIFHLVEDNVFNDYIQNLFNFSTKYVIIFATNKDVVYPYPHQRDRNFTKYIDNNITNFKLIRTIENPLKGTESQADFYIYEKI